MNIIKKEWVMLALMVVFIFCQCTPIERLPKTQQQLFDSILVSYYDKRFESKNNIQKVEILKEYDMSIYSFVDSITFCHNWNATIKNIELRYPNYTRDESKKILTFDLIRKLGDYQEITFSVEKTIDIDSLDEDVLYNSIKDVRDFSKVFFDGIIQTNSEKPCYSKYSEDGDDMRISYPHFNLTVLRISEESRDSLPKSLANLNHLDREFFSQLNKGNKKEIGEKYKESHQEVDSLNSSLSIKDKFWRKEFIQQLMLKYQGD